MISCARNWGAHDRPHPRRARAVYLTPLGLYSRYMLGAYLRHTMMVSAALMTIALTIDLWPQIAAVHAAIRCMWCWSIARLAALRLPDLLPPFLPFATFLGVVWSESAFTESRERLLIWNSGRSPLFCLMPALLAGLVMGGGAVRGGCAGCGPPPSMCRSPKSWAAKASAWTAARAAAITGSPCRTGCCAPRSNMARR